MADIRINALATTATTSASDDFIALDGTTNGTRKMNAATPAFLTSVTTPAVSGPSTTNLTLSGGSTGASLVLGQGSNNAVLTLPSGKLLAVYNASSANSIANIGLGTNSGFYFVAPASNQTFIGSGMSLESSTWIARGGTTAAGLHFNSNSFSWFTDSGLTNGNSFTPTERMRLSTGSNLLIGGTTDISGSGGLKVFGTTASTSTTSGALQVAGGVGVAGAGYFGGQIVANLSGGTGFETNDVSGSKYANVRSTGTNKDAAFSVGDLTNTWYSGVLGTVSTDGAYRIYDTATRVTIARTSGNVTLASTTASTSTTTGALVVSGGIGAAGAANVGTYYGMVDGVTAPGATVGYAKIYVDTADGDLKVVFGDGTIKTIATDT